MKNRMKIVVVIAILLLVGYVVSSDFDNNESNQEEITTIEEVKEVEEQPKEETVVVEVKASIKESGKKQKNTKKSKKSTSKATKKTVKKKKVVKKTTKTTKKVSYNKSEIQNYARSMMSSYGWSDNEWSALVQIINHESSWNPNAVNKKSGACGLFQALPCKKMAKYGSDYRTNYKTQIKFGFAYIKNRYKTPSKAWAFWQKHHWY